MMPNYEEMTLYLQMDIYSELMDPNHSEYKLHAADLGTIYGHFDAAQECRGHQTFDVPYTPSLVA